MTIVLFIIILATLILVHELGHFLLAKLCGIRVDEFALGFPPRIASKKAGETEYSLNLVPFGGYVRIYGEDAADALPDDPDAPRSFIRKNRAVQALVLVGGIAANIIFACILISFTFMAGAPVSASDYPGAPVSNAKLLVIAVLPNSPAADAGLQPGDALRTLNDGTSVIAAPSIENVQQMIARDTGQPIVLTVERGSREKTLRVTPETGVVGKAGGIGISMDKVGTLKLPFFSAIAEGTKHAMELLVLTAKAIAGFLGSAVTLHADFSQIAGPVGIAAMVGNAEALGWYYLVSFTALISLNLAVINLIPFPALDGGRLLFVLIEAIVRRPLPPKTVQTINAVGFFILIAALVIITYKDILKLV